MANSPVLDKANILKPAEDYNFLRREGIKQIEKLAGEVWTDYNTHDPGITILESLCYAITDLAYRTGFEMKDLVAPETVTNDSWKNIFYTARQILPCNPITINDYRKLLIDIEGVRNAWITKSEDCEVPVYIDYEEISKNYDTLVGFQKEKKLCCCESQIKLPYVDDVETEYEGLNFLKGKIIELNGLYKIILQFEEHIIEDHHKDVIRKKALKELHKHRNVCEDFLSITDADYRNFYLQAEIILKDTADPDEVLAEMCFRIQSYFTPNIKFYTLDELREKGKQVDEIFEGPLLEHGFILDGELESTNIFRDMRMSDIINSVSDIDGIIALPQFKINDPLWNDNDKDDPCGNEIYFDEWIAGMKNQKLVGKLSVDFIERLLRGEDITDIIPAGTFPAGYTPSIKFFKNGEEVKVNVDRFKKILTDKKKLDVSAKLKGHAIDLPVPAGENMQLTNFYPVQYQLPFTYRVGEQGLPMRDGHTRLIQALQLKGYLAVFEQIFLNYVSQLGNVNEIFSFNNVPYRGKSEHYPDPCMEKDSENPPNSSNEHWQPLKTEQPNYILYKDENGECKSRITGYLCLFSECEKYLAQIEGVIESEEDFEQRRNTMLDHLLARFAEEMNEYSALMKYLYPKDYLFRFIKNKTDFLQDYIWISRDRSRAYNYKLPEECNDFEGDWDEKKIAYNISGLEKRICRLLGYDNYQRKDIAPENLMIKENEDKTKFKIELYDPADTEYLLLETDWIEEKCRDEVIHCFIESGCCETHFIKTPENSSVQRRHPDKQRGYGFILLDCDERIIAQNPKAYPKPADRDKYLEITICALKKICNAEGLHMIEHILLRPKGDELINDKSQVPPVDVKFELLNICIDKCDLKLAAVRQQDMPEYKFEIYVLPPEQCLDGKRWIVKLVRIIRITGTGTETEPEEFSVIIERRFKEYELASKFISDLREYGSEYENYVPYKFSHEEIEKYFFIIYDENRKVIAESNCFDKLVATGNLPEVQTGRKKYDCMELLSSKSLFEEIVQLKKYLAAELDLYCCEDDCDHNEDPYSFRLTFVLPCWSKRFRDKNFRNFVEQTIHAETPAHIHARIFWLGIDEMKNYETAYNEWLVEMACNDVPDSGIVNDLTRVINNLQNCNDDCKDEDETNEDSEDRTEEDVEVIFDNAKWAEMLEEIENKESENTITARIAATAEKAKSETKTKKEKAIPAKKRAASKRKK